MRRPTLVPEDRDDPGPEPTLGGSGGPGDATPSQFADIPEWVSEIRRLYVEPKRQGEPRGAARLRRPDQPLPAIGPEDEPGEATRSRAEARRRERGRRAKRRRTLLVALLIVLMAATTWWLARGVGSAALPSSAATTTAADVLTGPAAGPAAGPAPAHRTS